MVLVRCHDDNRNEIAITGSAIKVQHPGIHPVPRAEFDVGAGVGVGVGVGVANTT